MEPETPVWPVLQSTPHEGPNPLWDIWRRSLAFVNNSFSPTPTPPSEAVVGANNTPAPSEARQTEPELRQASGGITADDAYMAGWVIRDADLLRLSAPAPGMRNHWSNTTPAPPAEPNRDVAQSSVDSGVIRLANGSEIRLTGGHIRVAVPEPHQANRNHDSVSVGPAESLGIARALSNDTLTRLSAPELGTPYALAVPNQAAAQFFTDPSAPPSTGAVNTPPDARQALVAEHLQQLADQIGEHLNGFIGRRPNAEQERSEPQDRIETVAFTLQEVMPDAQPVTPGPSWRDAIMSCLRDYVRISGRSADYILVSTGTFIAIRLWSHDQPDLLYPQPHQATLFGVRCLTADVPDDYFMLVGPAGTVSGRLPDHTLSATTPAETPARASGQIGERRQRLCLREHEATQAVKSAQPDRSCEGETEP